MPLSKAIIDQALENLKMRPKIQAQPFQSFAPVEFTQPHVVDPAQHEMLQNAIGDYSEIGTAQQTELTANEQAREDLAAAEAEVEENRRELRRAEQQEPEPVPRRGEGQPQSPTTWGVRPEVSDIGRLRPNAPLETVKWHGHNFEVNSQVAPIFVAFLNNLWRKGYKPTVIGGARPGDVIEGTDTTSLHSYGFAIDIDPKRNPVQYGVNRRTMQTTMPPHIAAIAAKYGLQWGGAWTGDKKDPMHFSIPFRGTM